MALKPCRECGKEVSTEAKSCPHCGVPDPLHYAGGPPETPSPDQQEKGAAAPGFRQKAKRFGLYVLSALLLLLGFGWLFGSAVAMAAVTIGLGLYFLPMLRDRLSLCARHGA